jgi:hypothetical protein
MAALRQDQEAPGMKFLLISFLGTALAAAFEPPERGPLSQRLAALRDWPSERNYRSG